MTLPQIISLVAAVIVASLYMRDLVPTGIVKREPETLGHLRNIIAVRDAYKTPEVTARCNALMEALLGIKP
jgi:hypothetical protein